MPHIIRTGTILPYTAQARLSIPFHRSPPPGWAFLPVHVTRPLFGHSALFSTSAHLTLPASPSQRTRGLCPWTPFSLILLPDQSQSSTPGCCFQPRRGRELKTCLGQSGFSSETLLVSLTQAHVPAVSAAVARRCALETVPALPRGPSTSEHPPCLARVSFSPD